MPLVELVLVLLSTALVCIVAVAWSIPGSNSKKSENGLIIPPGSMGWPFIGETIQFAKPHLATSLGDCIEKRIKRYGQIFSTHLLGLPTICSADPDLNRFVLLKGEASFEPWWPKSVSEILGSTWVDMKTGDAHRKFRGVFLKFISSQRFQDQYFSDYDRYTKKALESWEEGVDFPFLPEACKVTFNLITMKLLSITPGDPKAEELRTSYMSFIRGFTSVPLNFPGTTYRKALKSRGTIIRIVEGLLEERMRKKNKGVDDIGDADFLGVLLEDVDLTPKQICETIVGVLFGGHETTTLLITMAVYLLGSCPEAVEQLREEHLKIIKMKKQRGQQSELKAEDYKLMEFTQCVVNETLRLGNIVNGLPRRAIEDVEYKGYIIPSGWGMLLSFAAGHLDGSIYDDPKQFNPWRWQNKSTTLDKYFMPFGNGTHKCAGNELGKMEAAIFILNLVSKYEWKATEPDHPIARYTFVDFTKGLPIRVVAFCDKRLKFGFK